MRPFSLKIRLIAVLMLTAFLVSHLDPAYAQNTPAQTPSLVPQTEIHVPENLGKLESVSRVPGAKQTVIYIQDAHDSLEAQKNIAKLVRHFVKRYGVKTVFEEGFEGPVPTETFFGFMKDAAAKEKVSYFLLDKLRIGGAEYAHINRKEDFQLIGADDRKLHRENIEWYRKNAQVREAAAKDLGVLQKEISSLADRAFPKGLREWKKLRKRLDDGQISFPDYLKRFLAMNQEIPGFSLSVYPNLERLLKAQSAEGLDTKALFLEIEMLEKSFAESFLTNAEDKTLFEYDRALSLLARLNEIQLTPSEFEAAQAHLAQINTRSIAEFIVKHTYRSLVLSKQWETQLKHASAFYETAHRRDEAVLKAVQKSGDKEPVSVLVFGGFHEQGIKEKLLKNGYSVLTVFPKITEQDPQHQASYKQLMADGHYPFEASFQMARAASPEHGYSWNGAAPEILAIYETAKRFPDLSAPLLVRKIETELQGPAARLPSTRAEMRPEIEAALKTIWAEAARTTKEILSLMIEGREDLHQKEQLFMVFKNYPDLQKEFPQFFRLYAPLPSVLAAAKNFLDQYPNSFFLYFRWDHVNGRMRQLNVGALSQDLVRYGADPVTRAREILERLQETEARLRLILFYNQLTAPVFRPAGGPEHFARQIKAALVQSPEFHEWMKIRERIRTEGVPAYAGLPVPVPESERDAYEQRVAEAVRGEELFSVTLPHFIPEDKFHQAYSIGSFEEDREAEAWAKTLQNQKLLDIGASFGGLVKYLRKHGVDAWGIDADRDSVNKAALAGVKSYIRFGDVRFLPYENDSFDAVHSRAVLSSRGVLRPLMRHGDDVAAGAVRSPEDLIAAFLEIKRVLKPGGKAYLENIFNPEEILMLASVTGMSLVRSRIAGEYYTVFMKENPRHENRGEESDEAVSFGETSADSTITETAIAKILEEQKHPFRQVPMELFRAAVMAGIFLSFAWFVYRPWVQPWVEKSPLHLILGMNVLSVFKSVIVGWLGLRFARFVGSAKSKSHEIRAWIGQILYGVFLSVPIFGFFVTSWFMGKLPVPDPLPEKMIQALVHQGIIAPLLYDPLHYITAKMVIERNTYAEVTNSKMAGNILNYTGLAFVFWFFANWIALLIPDLSWRFIFTNTVGFVWGVAFFVMLRAENLGFLRNLGIARGKTFEEAPQPLNPFYWLYRYYQQPWFGIAMLSGTYWLYIASFTRQIYLLEPRWSSWVPVLAVAPWAAALARSGHLKIKPVPAPSPASHENTIPPSAPDAAPGSRNEAREENRDAFVRDDQGQLILNPALPEMFESEKMLALWRRLDKDGLRYTGETGSVTPSAIHVQAWTMNDFREEDFTTPLKDLETLRARPLKLLFPNRVRLSPVHGMNNNGIFINYAEGIDHPILVKTFKEDVTQIRNWQPLEIFAAQLNDFAGTGPRFYGIIADDPWTPGKITEYAMQAGAGRFAKIGEEYEEAVEGLSKRLEAGASEIYRARMAEMKIRLLHFGLSPDGLNYLVRQDGTVTSLDAGDLIYDFLNETGFDRRAVPEHELFEIMRKKREAAAVVRAETRHPNSFLRDDKGLLILNPEFSDLSAEYAPRLALWRRLEQEGIGYQDDFGYTDLDRLPDAPWLMRELREEDTVRPLRTFDELKARPLKLLYPNSARADLVGGVNNLGIYLNYVEGIHHPVAVKMLRPAGTDRFRRTWNLLEILAAQLNDFAGTGPEFYGVTVDTEGEITGYAMQIVKGSLAKVTRTFDESVELTLKFSGMHRHEAAAASFRGNMTEIQKRLESYGLNVKALNYMYRPDGTVTAVDAGDLILPELVKENLARQETTEQELFERMNRKRETRLREVRAEHRPGLIIRKDSEHKPVSGAELENELNRNARDGWKRIYLSTQQRDERGNQKSDPRGLSGYEISIAHEILRTDIPARLEIVREKEPSYAYHYFLAVEEKEEARIRPLIDALTGALNYRTPSVPRLPNGLVEQQARAMLPPPVFPALGYEPRNLEAAQEASIGVSMPPTQNYLSPEEKETILSAKGDGRTRIYLSTQTISEEGERATGEQTGLFGYEASILALARDAAIPAELEEMPLPGDLHPERHVGFFEHDYFLSVPDDQADGIRKFISWLADRTDRTRWNATEFYEGELERAARATFSASVSIDLGTADYNTSAEPYWTYWGLYESADRIERELKALGMEVFVSRYDSGELNSPDRHFSHSYIQVSLQVRPKDVPAVRAFLARTEEEQRKQNGILARDEKFNALYQAAVRIQPDVAFDTLYQAYLAAKPSFRTPVYSEGGNFRRFEIENTEHRIDDNTDMERFQRKIWSQGLTQDSPFLAFLREKLHIENASLEGKTDIVESAQHWATGYYTSFLNVPKEHEALMEFYLAAGSDAVQAILFGGAEDIENEVRLGVRILGERPDTTNIGNKEAGFLIFKKLGLPYPPGIALSEKLVRSILQKSSRDAEVYVTHLQKVLRQAGVKRELYSVRSNPKQSMPGVLDTVAATEFILPAIYSAGQAWFSEKAKSYRKRQGLADDYDLPLIIQEWEEAVKTKLQGGYYFVTDTEYPQKRAADPSLPFYGSGVFSTRNPNTGEDILFGRYMENSRGDALMTGGSGGLDIQLLAQSAPEIYRELEEAKAKLEEAVGPQEVEFTVVQGKLYFLQTRKLHFAPAAEISFLRSQIQTGKITEARALPRIEKLQTQLGARKIYRVKDGALVSSPVFSKGSTAGALRGQLAWNVETARRLMNEKKPVIFAAEPGSADRILPLLFEYPSSGLITSYGNSSSHEAVLTRLAGIPSLIHLDATFSFSGDHPQIVLSNAQVLHEEDWVVIDADRGRLFTADEEVLEENGTMQDASYGIHIPDFKKEFIAPYYDAAGNLLPEFTIDRLEVLNQEAEQKFFQLQKGGDKKAAFTANLEKHFLHEMLLARQREAQSAVQAPVVIFVDGNSGTDRNESRTEELAVLASADPKRQIVVYHDGAGRLAEFLKSFRLKNVKFVKGGFAEALAPYQHRTSVNLIFYGDDETENTEAWTRERLTRFAGEPGALDYGLKHLDAVRLKKKVEEIQWVVNERGVGYYIVSREASSAAYLLQQAQYVTVFARAA